MPENKHTVQVDAEEKHEKNRAKFLSLSDEEAEIS